jgi:hypothetical protein
MTALALGVIVLWGFKWAEENMQMNHHAILMIRASSRHPDYQEVRTTLRSAGYSVASCAEKYAMPEGHREMRYGIVWRSVDSGVATPPPFVKTFASHAGVLSVVGAARIVDILAIVAIAALLTLLAFPEASGIALAFI